MLQSLYKVAALPDATRVCCTHGYTLSTLQFATVVEAGSTQLIHYQQQCEVQRGRGTPTLPTSIAVEKAINPFLRTMEERTR